MNSTALSPLERKLCALLNRRRTASTLRNLALSDHQIDFSSNDFLSLSMNKDFKTAYIAELNRSDLPLGSGGSRLLDGNSSYAESLEKHIAEFHGAEAGLLFNSGFDANAGFFACVPQPGDVVLHDELIHASVHDGMRLSRAARTLVFRHNCIAHLERILNELLNDEEMGPRLRDGESHVFVAIEAIYSMDGDLAPLESIIDVVEKILPKGAGYIVVDEAHATGVLGPQGRGLVSSLGMHKHIFARLHTFGKALGCNGAIILGSPLLRHYLINYARPLIYTTFMSYPALAAIRTAYEFLREGRTTRLADDLQILIQTLFTQLSSVQTPAFRSLFRMPRKSPRSPIFSIQLDEPKVLAGFLQQRGMMVRAIVPPTVPEGTSRIRICLHAGNTVEQIQKLVMDMEQWCVERSGEPPNLERNMQSKKGVINARL